MKTGLESAVSGLCDEIDRLRDENKKLLEALNKIGVLMCDATVGDMVKAGVLKDGLCEEGETETGLALIVIGCLFNKVQDIKRGVIAKARNHAW